MYLPPYEIPSQAGLDKENAWKGKARYYDIVVGEKVNKNAAWNYPEPKEAAQYLKGYVAFERGVQVER